MLNLHKGGQSLTAGRILVPIHWKIWYFRDLPRLIPAKIDFFHYPLNLIAPNCQLWGICRSVKISSLKVIKYQVPELNCSRVTLVTTFAAIKITRQPCKLQNYKKYVNFCDPVEVIDSKRCSFNRFPCSAVNCQCPWKKTKATSGGNTGNKFEGL